jgi:hypothetical protein
MTLAETQRIGNVVLLRYLDSRACLREAERQPGSGDPRAAAACRLIPIEVLRIVECERPVGRGRRHELEGRSRRSRGRAQPRCQELAARLQAREGARTCCH